MASNMIGLAYIAAAQGRRDEARATLDQAAAIVEATGARTIMRHIQEARSHLSQAET